MVDNIYKKKKHLQKLCDRKYIEKQYSKNDWVSATHSKSDLNETIILERFKKKNWLGIQKIGINDSLISN